MSDMWNKYFSSLSSLSDSLNIIWDNLEMSGLILPEHMPMVAKYQISGTLAGNLRMIVEQFLKVVADRWFSSVFTILSQNSVGCAS